ncbi:hypothetical protein IJT17_01610 [bacterium]|nr:hypothetical protein [bacterium]
MKKLLSIVFASILGILLTLPAFAVGRADLSAADRDYLDTFFSNFAEAGVESFVVNNEIPRDIFVDFGVRHNLINRQYDLVKVNEGYWGVKKEAVEAAVYKYFGHRIKAASSRQYKLTNNLYIVPKSSGEALTFAQIAEWDADGNGVWHGVANVYVASSGFTGNVHGNAAEWKKAEPHDVPRLKGRYSFTVTRSPSDPGRYVLCDWLELP